MGDGDLVKVAVGVKEHVTKHVWVHVGVWLGVPVLDLVIVGEGVAECFFITRR